MKFPAREITFGSDNAILLDGALSADLDHRAGAALRYDWICETLEGRPCYVLQAAAAAAGQQLLKERFAADTDDDAAVGYPLMNKTPIGSRRG